jgi:hypothetical protein
LDGVSPASATAKYSDSASLKFSGGNPWKPIGTWFTSPTLTNGSLNGSSSLTVWLGLKNSDDQGTRFDLRGELYRNGSLVSSGEMYCVTGVTRNPALAEEVTVLIAPALGVAFDGATDGLSMKILTRIGTNGQAGFCGGHSNAAGLRLYFDASHRASRLILPF